MPIDPNIPLSVQTSQFGTIAGQAIQQRRANQRQQAADERANELLQLRKEKFAVEKSEAEDKIKRRDFSNFAVSTLEPIYGQDPKLIEDALQTEIERVVPGSLESEPFEDALEIHRSDPAAARRVFVQAVAQARSDKLIPELVEKKDFTLGQGQKRFTAEGKVIASVAPKLTAATRKKAENAKGVEATLDKLEQLTDASFRGEAGAINRIVDDVVNTWGRFTQNDQELVLFEAFSQGTVAQLVRAAGERGALSNQDIQRGLNLIPKSGRGFTELPDSRAVAKGKIKQLREWFNDIAGPKTESRPVKDMSDEELLQGL